MRYGFDLEGWKAAAAIIWLIWSSAVAVLYVLGLLP